MFNLFKSQVVHLLTFKLACNLIRLLIYLRNSLKLIKMVCNYESKECNSGLADWAWGLIIISYSQILTKP